MPAWGEALMAAFDHEPAARAWAAAGGLPSHTWWNIQIGVESSPPHSLQDNRRDFWLFCQWPYHYSGEPVMVLKADTGVQGWLRRTTSPVCSTASLPHAHPSAPRPLAFCSSALHWTVVLMVLFLSMVHTDESNTQLQKQNQRKYFTCPQQDIFLWYIIIFA